jgi:hypothetical protein
MLKNFYIMNVNLLKNIYDCKQFLVNFICVINCAKRNSLFKEILIRHKKKGIINYCFFAQLIH